MLWGEDFILRPISNRPNVSVAIEQADWKSAAG
jgi:hypothetical protein